MNSWIVCVIALATFYNVLSEVSSASLKTERQAFLKKEVQNLLLEELASELFAKKQGHRSEDEDATTPKPNKRKEDDGLYDGHYAVEKKDNCEDIKAGCKGCKDKSPIEGFD